MPILFHEFCERILKLKLTTGQSVLAKLAFGDLQPTDLSGEELEAAHAMLGSVSYIPPKCRRKVVLRLGRGSGKTTICAAWSIYTAVTQDIKRCGPGDVPVVVVVAPDKPTAQLSIRMCREMIRSVPALEKLVRTADGTSIELVRPDSGRAVRVEAFAATRGGSSIRGRSILSFVLDEAEFFASDENDYAVTDRAIYRALNPRLLPNGKGLFLSTPWPVETLMGELFDANFTTPNTALAFVAPTTIMRPGDQEIADLVAEEMRIDPDNARREFFCEVDKSVGGEFFDGSSLVRAAKDVLEFPIARNPAWPVAVAADFAFKQDSSALVVVQYDGKYYRTSQIVEISPKGGEPLKPSKVVEEFAKVCKEYDAPGIISDGHYREALKEHLANHKLSLWDAPEGVTGKQDVYTRTRAVLHEDLVLIPNNNRLIQQAKSVRALPSSGGRLTIRTPRRSGMGHGDIVSAWTLAVHHLAYSAVKVEKHEPTFGTEEWNAMVANRIKAADSRRMSDHLRKIERESRAAKGFSGPGWGPSR